MKIFGMCFGGERLAALDRERAQLEGEIAAAPLTSGRPAAVGSRRE